MSYNIHTGKGIDGKLDLDRIASVILREKPDIVGLNEIESYVDRSQCTNQIEYIAKKTNMYFAFGPNLIGNANCGNCTTGLFGNAVLSKHKISKVVNHKLYREDKEETRGCLETEIEIDGQKFTFLTTHLDCNRKEDIRNNQANDILKIIDEKDMPVIFASDMNAYIRTDGNDVENAAKIFTENLFDAANTNPELKNIGTLIKGKRIDFIFVNQPLADSVVSYKVVNYGDAKFASDHYPVVAEIKK
ncbi:MAG: hypothetical protein A2Y10_00330 [Planctomycetes bacterium GWF2_41_51]|nr:MAG: hypothetical protein A2Y10_00330 [Planctomycetes bacterium GWF2_41_51]